MMKEHPKKPLSEKQVSKIYRVAKSEYSSSYAMMIDDAFRGAQRAAQHHNVWTCYDSPWFSLMLRHIRAHRRWDSIPEGAREEIVAEFNGPVECRMTKERAQEIFDRTISILRDSEEPFEDVTKQDIINAFFNALDERREANYSMSRPSAIFRKDPWFVTFANAVPKGTWKDLSNYARTQIYRGLARCVRIIPFSVYA